MGDRGLGLHGWRSQAWRAPTQCRGGDTSGPGWHEIKGRRWGQKGTRKRKLDSIPCSAVSQTAPFCATITALNYSGTWWLRARALGCQSDVYLSFDFYGQCDLGKLSTILCFSFFTAELRFYPMVLLYFLWCVSYAKGLWQCLAPGKN